MARYTRLPHAETVPLSSKSDNDPDDDDPESYPATRPDPPSYLLWLAAAALCLSALVAALLPATLSASSSRSLSRREWEDLPYPDQHLGLDRVQELLPPAPARYRSSWPRKIARVNQKLKNAVYGNGVQVFISVEVGVGLCFLWVSALKSIPPGLHDHAVPHPTHGDRRPLRGHVEAPA